MSSSRNIVLHRKSSFHPTRKRVGFTPQFITHILVTPKDVKGYFEEESLLLVEQITVVAKKKIISKVGHIPETSEVMKKVNDAIIKQLGVDM